jgi:hypothetical protein
MWIVRRLGWFVDWAPSNKIWCLGGAAFLSILWFLVSFGEQLPEQLENFEANSIKFEMYLRDLEKMRALMGHMQQAAFGYLVPVQLYDEIASRAALGSFPPDEIANGLKAATDARNRIATAAGMIQGTTFTDSRLQALKDSLQKYTEQLGNMAVTVQEVFSLLGAGKKEDAAAKIIDLNRSPQILERMTAANARLRDSSINMPLIGREYIHNVHGKLIEARMFTIKLLVAITGLCYEVAFVVLSCTILFWRRRVGTENTTCPSEEMIGSIPPNYSGNQSKRAREVRHRPQRWYSRKPAVRRSNRSPPSRTPWPDHRH